MTDSTTFSSLMDRAALALDRAAADGHTVGIDAEAAWAHQQVVGALNHLSQTLTRTAQGQDAEPQARPNPSAGSPRDHSPALLAEGTSRDLHRAAQLIHAAADLWSTHQTPTGAPRSPEAARMRHPAVLGAAMRRWRGLAARASALTPAGAGPTGHIDCEPAASAHVRPDSGSRGSRLTHGDPLAIPVARPRFRPGGAPLDELSGRIAALRQYAWQLCERQIAPAVVLRNLAELGVLVSTGSRMTCALGRDGHGEGCPGHDMAPEAWNAVRRALSPIRSAHPTTHVIQVELVQVARRVEEVLALHRRGAQHDEVCLCRFAAPLTDVATFSARAVRVSHSRGDLYVTGRGIPGSLTSKHPDLLRAKLEGGVVPAPTEAIRQALRAYRDVVSLLPAPGNRMRVA